MHLLTTDYFLFVHADFRDDIPTFSISEKNHEDINLQQVKFSQLVYDRMNLCSSNNICIYDNIYQQIFDPLQNVSCKFRELI